ncbi:hypothetical protein BK660_21845 [Pseudomonas brassicacearum]|uniref:DUF2591 domain-containing protein n=1 Tax=Pseudomonas brassicacearum TaxID=930166 RepID=A0A423HXJ2_9PSED|nr:hypothetical protein [Pseudomonas brassicacearum]RON17935.1 hypothetical protein BK660_21845 [Pseudomonas brassicacearum]
MNDRELLELAAKAAGLELDWDVPDGASPWVITGAGDERGPGACWNPLDDDGDAFRLAVDLRIYTAPGPGSTCEAVTNFGWVCAVGAMNRAEAMRRAIVEAAVSVARLEQSKEKDQLIPGMDQPS